MNNSEIHDYWRWELVRQVSYFINDPGERNTEALLKMIETYSKVSQSLAIEGSRIRIEPLAADFVCTMDI